ncbi:MAG TPA: response regulator, partial [Ignavibacteriaceae bacterium]|nr:response regulator [Ignavibacteriaceae bacterium]
ELENKKVLIIDDNEISLRSLTEQVLSWNMIPIRTTYPQVALDILKKDVFDAAIIDQHMPFMEGFTLVEKIRELKNGRTIPVIVLGIMTRRLRNSTRPDMISIINKPVKYIQLRDTLRNLLNKDNAVKKENDSKSKQALPGVQYPLRILLAEDNAVNQKVALKMLERLGYRGDIAANGLEVLDAIQKIHYDLVLMDMYMPEMDGIETSRLIVSAIPREKQPVIIAMTANNIEENKEACLAAGMSDFLQKPMTQELLRDCLMKWGEIAANEKQKTNKTPQHSIINEEKITFLQDVQSNEDAAFLIELLDVYINELPKTISKILNAIESENSKELLFNSHKLKGSSLTLGMDVISEISIKLENAAKAGIFNETVRKLGDELFQKVEIVGKELELIRKKYNKFINQT